VIATPSALHSEQAIAAAESGLAVFCQKPLGINLRETARAINAARTANRLLHVDLCYRFLEGVTEIRRLIQDGELGEIHSADFTFHNAYGPDKPWFYDPRLSGGGCLIDLGIHLVDLALWLFDFQRVAHVTASLFAHGRRFAGRNVEVEDFADTRLRFESGAIARVSCSWRAHAGRDAVIEFSLYGTRGGVALRNVNGSFYDFVAEHYTGTSRRVLATPPDDWGGRAAINWLMRLRESNEFDPAIENLNAVASVLDRIYAS
jgi:predicted dehydrogenase